MEDKTYIYYLFQNNLTALKALARKGWELDIDTKIVSKHFRIDPHDRILPQFRLILARYAEKSEENKKQLEELGFAFAFDATDGNKLVLEDTDALLDWRIFVDLLDDTPMFSATFGDPELSFLIPIFCDAEVIDRIAPEIAKDFEEAGIEKADYDEIPELVAKVKASEEMERKRREEDKKREA